MKRFEKHVVQNWKFYFVLFAILFLVYIFGYIIIHEHLIGKTRIDYNLAFDNIKCCMTYDNLVLLFGEGEASIFDYDKARVIKSDYRESKINDLNPVGNQTVLYSFTNGAYRIATEGKKLMQAQLYFNAEQSGILKQIDNCVC